MEDRIAVICSINGYDKPVELRCTPITTINEIIEFLHDNKVLIDGRPYGPWTRVLWCVYWCDNLLSNDAVLETISDTEPIELYITRRRRDSDEDICVLYGCVTANDIEGLVPDCMLNGFEGFNVYE